MEIFILLGIVFFVFILPPHLKSERERGRKKRSESILHLESLLRLASQQQLQDAQKTLLDGDIYYVYGLGGFILPPYFWEANPKLIASALLAIQYPIQDKDCRELVRVLEERFKKDATRTMAILIEICRKNRRVAESMLKHLPLDVDFS